MALLNGSTLIIPHRQTIEDHDAFQDFIQSSGITIATLPPPYADNLEPERMASLRLLVTAGSASSRDLVEKWQDRVQYINAYGPSETSICATAWHAERNLELERNIPIGKPITNMNIHILDANLQLQPVSIPGEICVSGIGLGIGYLNRPTLTVEKFITHATDQGPLPLYRTGDLGRWLPDGNIEFLGRIDRQIKIRGYRIELGEIENTLLGHSQIKQAAVDQIVNQEGDKYLCGYLVSDIQLSDILEEIKEYASKILPDYMIPSHFVQVQEMPLTSSGKVDFKMLAHQNSQFLTSGKREQYIAPRNQMEEMITQIWEKILIQENIGIHDNLFDIGGNSLSAVKIAGRLKEAVGKNVPVVMVFQHPTVAALAQYLAGEGESDTKEKETQAGMRMEDSLLETIDAFEEGF